MSLLDGIIGCWSPSVRGSGYLLPDLSGRGNHGTLTNMDAGTDWPGSTIFGRSGRVLSYNDPATEKRVDIGKQLPGVAGLRELTVTMWARRRAANGIANAGQVVGGNSYWNIVPFSDGNVYFQIAPNFVSVADNVLTWRFWSMTLTGSTIRGFRDGVSVVSATGPATMPTVAANFVIGSYPTVSTKANSEIGEVAVFQRALAQAEVMELYRSGNGAIGRQLTGQTRRRVYGFVPPTGARRRRILCGDYS